jgi:hypothetical protein
MTRKLTDISSEEFLKAYNDPSLDNKGVVAKLDCGNWSVIGVRLRSEANQLRTTMKREGGMEGTHRPLTKAEIKAKTDGGDAARSWLQANAAPGAGAAASPPDAASSESAGDPAGDPPAPAGDAPTSEAAAGGAVGTAEAIGEFVFIAEMSGQKLRFKGPTVTEATNALMAKLREQNYSKIQITKAVGGQTVGMNEIENGGSYRISKQLTAADETPPDSGVWIDVPAA